jgi:uncharacterized membrane protein
LVALLPLAGVFVVVACCFAGVARYGFNPTDEGLITSASYRILQGQIPHLDIVSVRPLGSAVLHTIDVLLPTPLILTSRAIAWLEVTTYSVLFGALAFRRAPGRWGIGEAACVAAAALVNIHTFPLAAWHTVDGLLFSAVGFALVRSGIDRDRDRRLYGAFLVLGAAVLMKQSFAPAPVAGLVWVAVSTRQSGRPVLGRVVRFGLVSALPGALYLAVIAAFGGLGDTLSQTTGGRLVIGGEVLLGLRHPEVVGAVGVVLVGLSAALLLQGLGERASGRRAGSVLGWADVAIRAGLTAYLVWVCIGNGLALDGTWGIALLWMLVATVVWRAVVEHRIDGMACLLIVVGWMASLSWGYAVPDLVAGSLALMVGRIIWMRPTSGGLRRDHRRARMLFGAAGIAGLLLVTAVFVDARLHTIYREPPASQLTADLGTVNRAFWGIRSDPATEQYLDQITSCIDRHPARYVAVLPDNAAIYGALGLDNPFPLDWMYPPELVGSEHRILQRADQLSRSGDYLVLVQTVAAQGVADSRIPPDVPPGTPEYLEGIPLGVQVLARLHGQRVACGSFVAVYQP